MKTGYMESIDAKNKDEEAFILALKNQYPCLSPYVARQQNDWSKETQDAFVAMHKAIEEYYRARSLAYTSEKDSQ